MGRCGGWIKGLALLLVALTIGCGDTGSNKSSSTGKPFVFQSRGRLNLAVQVDPTDPKFLYLTATLLDPQGNPFRNQRVTFEAEFVDAIFIPANTPQNDPLACLDRSGVGNATRCTNRGAAITDDNGQARVTLFAIVGSSNAPRNPGRLMRVIAEAPNSLNIASSISVPFTNAGFIFAGTLSIIPPQVTFINPLVRPGTDGPKVTFSAQGGRPPYRWDNQNKDLGRITIKGQQNINEQAEYTLTGPINTTTAAALTDTILLNDALGGTAATATVNVIFADCQLKADGKSFTFGAARGGETFSVSVTDGVAPFTITEDFPGTLTANSPTTQCDSSQKNCSLLFTLATPPRGVSPDNIIVRDARGCTAQVSLTITPRCGNGTADSGEVCDGTALRGLTCADALDNQTAVGPLLCSADCSAVDDGFCRIPTAAPLCGNGAINPGEVCDGTNFQGVTCADILGNSTAVGTLRCTANCTTIDSTFCRLSTATPFCGNNVIDAGEECDGTNLRGVTCADILRNASAEGPLLCSSTCTYNDQFCRLPAPPSNVLLSADVVQICSTAGGNAVISILALDDRNNPFPDLTFLFSTTAGTFNGQTSTTATTGANGRTTVTLTIPAGTPAQVVTVTATATATVGLTRTVTIPVFATGGGNPTCP